jgi:large subunit ribosomal protein L13
MASKISRKTFTLDATDRSLGRLAVEVSVLLRGKDKAEFVPYQDLGDFVKVTNLTHIKFTGNKIDQKVYYRHSGYVGHLKKKQLKEFVDSRLDEVLRKAVWGMMPKNKLRKDQIKRLIVE